MSARVGSGLNLHGP